MKISSGRIWAKCFRLTATWPHGTVPTPARGWGAASPVSGPGRPRPPNSGPRPLGVEVGLHWERDGIYDEDRS